MPYDLAPYLARPEQDCVEGLIAALDWDTARASRVSEKSAAIIRAMRSVKRKSGSIESFFQTYSLSSEEGIALMCLAEALLRIPDADTADALIRDKIAGTAWVTQEMAKDDWKLKMASMGLSASRSTLEGKLAGLGAPVIRAALHRFH